jgi:hypothetical protein
MPMSSIPDTADTPDETGRPAAAGAVITALTVVEALENRASGRPPAEITEEIRLLLEHWDTAEILRAFALLIHSAMRLIERSEAQPDALTATVGPVLARLRALAPPELPPDALPAAAGILTAAALGHDPYAWWSRLEPAGEPEADLPTWSYPAWLLVDYVDAAVLDQPGAFARMVTATVIEDRTTGG